MKNKFIKNSIIASSVIFMFLMIDLIFKYYVFEYHGDDRAGPVQGSYTVIGFRSYAHTSSTIFSSFNMKVGDWVRVSLPMVVGIVLVIGILFQKNIGTTITLSLIAAGVFGNLYDNMVHGYVRDILFTPFHDKGTFNPADIFITFGGILFVITIIYYHFKEKREK